MDKPLILSVDDREESQALINNCLGKDYQLITAMTVKEAITAASQSNPTIILMDIDLPDGTGYDACRYIFSQERTQAPDIIFISGLNSLDDRLEAYRCGGSDYLSKPINPEELKAKVRLTIENQIKKKELAEQAKLATETALTAMSNSGEQGTLLSFSTETFTCQNFEALANACFNLFQSFGLSGSIRLDAEPSELSFSSSGIVTPLENQLLTNAANSQRIVSRGNRTLFNDGLTTVLIKNMPIDNEALYGRLKDHIALVCKTINARASTLILEFQNQQRRIQGANYAIQRIKDSMSSLDQNILQIEAKLRHLVDDLLMFYEEELLSMGLSDDQEERLLSPLNQTKEQFSDLFDITEALEHNMQSIESTVFNVVSEG